MRYQSNIFLRSGRNRKEARIKTYAKLGLGSRVVRDVLKSISLKTTIDS